MDVSSYSSTETYKRLSNVMNTTDPLGNQPPEPMTLEQFDATELDQMQPTAVEVSTVEDPPYQLYTKHTPPASPPSTASIPHSSPSQAQSSMVIDESSNDVDLSSGSNTPTLTTPTITTGMKRRASSCNVIVYKERSKRQETTLYPPGRKQPHRALNYSSGSSKPILTPQHDTDEQDLPSSTAQLNLGGSSINTSAYQFTFSPERRSSHFSAPSSPVFPSPSSVRSAPSRFTTSNFLDSSSNNTTPHGAATTTAKQPLIYSLERDSAGRTLRDNSGMDDDDDDDNIYMDGLKSVKPVTSEQPPSTIFNNMTPFNRDARLLNLRSMNSIGDNNIEDGDESFSSELLPSEHTLLGEEPPGSLFDDHILTPFRK